MHIATGTVTFPEVEKQNLPIPNLRLDQDYTDGEEDCRERQQHSELGKHSHYALMLPENIVETIDCPGYR